MEMGTPSAGLVDEDEEAELSAVEAIEGLVAASASAWERYC